MTIYVDTRQALKNDTSVAEFIRSVHGVEPRHQYHFPADERIFCESNGVLGGVLRVGQFYHVERTDFGQIIVPTDAPIVYEGFEFIEPSPELDQWLGENDLEMEVRQSGYVTRKSYAVRPKGKSRAHFEGFDHSSRLLAYNDRNGERAVTIGSEHHDSPHVLKPLPTLPDGEHEVYASNYLTRGCLTPFDSFSKTLDFLRGFGEVAVSLNADGKIEPTVDGNIVGIISGVTLMPFENARSVNDCLVVDPDFTMTVTVKGDDVTIPTVNGKTIITVRELFDLFTVRRPDVPAFRARNITFRRTRNGRVTTEPYQNGVLP